MKDFFIFKMPEKKSRENTRTVPCTQGPFQALHAQRRGYSPGMAQSYRISVQQPCGTGTRS